MLGKTGRTGDSAAGAEDGILISMIHGDKSARRRARRADLIATGEG